ncbi:hypothetical protein JDN40_12400 [Rhodomicrobium vannielii ATCC 17100]|uniref:hypothetical protein n=1 Tax=Rhodomicrobium vannielii TaxID=1069 RepID=UPI0019188B77|nr:hypothetical protein [Rhodomicrobium vannielii]MBJ7534908.1 hypothetical protein [Rhodomicrobium vannielii ATCC 17100]
MKMDALCEFYAAKGVKLTTRELPGDSEDMAKLVLIEGDKDALKFLGEMILSVAESKEEGNFSMSPSGPGSIFFSKGSGYGFYINKT